MDIDVLFCRARDIVALCICAIAPIRVRPLVSLTVAAILKAKIESDVAVVTIPGSHKTATKYGRAWMAIPVAVYNKILEFMEVSHKPQVFSKVDNWGATRLLCTREGRAMQSLNNEIKAVSGRILGTEYTPTAFRRFMAEHVGLANAEEYSTVMLHSITTAHSHYHRQRKSRFFVGK